MAEEVKRKVGRPSNKKVLDDALKQMNDNIELDKIIKKLKADLKAAENQRDSYKNLAEEHIKKSNEQLEKQRQQYEDQLKRCYKRLGIFIKFIELQDDVLDIMKGV